MIVDFWTNKLPRYVPEVDGIVVAHSGLRFETANGRIMYDSPFSHFFVRVKLLVWKPNKGEKLGMRICYSIFDLKTKIQQFNFHCFYTVGKINLQSADHIGLLIYGTFNASIPREHISQAHFEWRASAEEEKQPEEEESAEETEKPYEYTQSEFGEWVVKATGQGVGQDNGVLEFSVVK
jgi:DNA-directed RNA polymerase I subunit RPA43